MKKGALNFAISHSWLHFRFQKVWTYYLASQASKFVSSKHLFQVRLEILSCSVENMASQLLTKYITWRKSCQSLRSLESLNRCTCTSWHGFPFLLVKCVLKCCVAHTWWRISASLNYERFHGHQVKMKEAHFTPSHSK